MLYLAMIGFGELWPILIVLLLLFGAKKLPELARAMGSSINMFKKGLSDDTKPDELERGSSEPPAKLKAGSEPRDTGAGERTGEPSSARGTQGESSSK